MDLGLEGRVALVTAASRGLGRASALALLREGAAVFLLSRSEDRLASAASELALAGLPPNRRASDRMDPVSADDADIWLGQGQRRAQRPVRERIGWFAGDLADPEVPGHAVAAAVERFGRLDIVVANSGGPAPGPFESITDPQWEHAVDSMINGYRRLVRAALPQLRSDAVRAAGGGRIVFIASSSAKSPVPNLATSNVIRPAVIGLMKTLSIELGPDGILVNAVGPGRLATERIEELDRAAAEREGTTVEAIAERQRAGIPLGRYGDPDELGAVVAFLCSARASYVSGTLIAIDGGATRTLL
jgi:3-oxoacyl-[acyl-carrier protein] reductase